MSWRSVENCVCKPRCPSSSASIEIGYNTEHYNGLILLFKFVQPRDSKFWSLDSHNHTSRVPRTPKRNGQTKTLEVHKILHTKHQSSTQSSFIEEELWSLPLFLLCSNFWPPGLGQFLPQEHHMNESGRIPLGDAAYQISNLYTIQFQRRNFKLVFFVPVF